MQRGSPETIVEENSTEQETPKGCVFRLEGRPNRKSLGTKYEPSPLRKAKIMYVTFIVI